MSKELHLQFYDQIGSDFWSGEGTTAKGISEQLTANPEASEIILHINSPGGSVYEGYTIYNLLKASGKKITAKIEGYCASIATLIALSAEDIEMLPLAQWMIHNPFTFIEGTAEDLEQAAAELKRIEAVLVGVYVSRTGKTEDEIKNLMLEDRFINAEEAVEMGFATRVLEPLKAVAFYKSNNSIKPTTEMSETKAPSPWAKIKAKLLAAFDEAEETETPQAASELLEDGSSFYFEGELAVSTPVFSDEAMTNALAAGDYILTDGRTMVVADGIVTDIKEVDATNDASEALAAKDAEIERLTNELATATAQASAKDTTIKNLRAEVATAKKKTPSQNHAADNSGNAAPELTPFNNAAEKLKSKYNRK